ncbi:hypothetical protein MHYP_G00174970 [Metynnis hypsauchen]
MTSSSLPMPSLVLPISSSSVYRDGDMTTTPTILPSLQPGEDYMNVHNIIIVIIFCMVCFLLLMAFFYTFCFHCTLKSSAKDSHTNAGCSMEREDATYRRSSSSPSLGNTI